MSLKINNEDLDQFIMKKTKIKLGKTPADKYTWTDENGNKVAQFEVWDWWDGKNISNLKVYDEYKGRGLSYELLDYATKDLGVRNLAVAKDNNIAKHVYDKYGFMTTDEDSVFYYMSLPSEK